MDEETYDIQVTVENLGEDWEGTVRVMVDESYRMSTAYDVKLSLPEGSEKHVDQLTKLSDGRIKLPADFQFRDSKIYIDALAAVQAKKEAGDSKKKKKKKKKQNQAQA